MVPGEEPIWDGGRLLEELAAFLFVIPELLLLLRVQQGKDSVIGPGHGPAP